MRLFKKMEKKSGISTKKVDEHFGYLIQLVIGLEKITTQAVYLIQRIGEV